MLTDRFNGYLLYGKKRFSSFISKFIDKNLVEFVPNGECIGEHNGLHLYTMGSERDWNRRLKGGKFWKYWFTWFVAEKVDENTLVVVQGFKSHVIQGCD